MADVKRVKTTRFKSWEVECFTYYPSLSQVLTKNIDRLVRGSAEAINQKDQ